MRKIIFLLPLVFGIFMISGTYAWWSGDWVYRRSITITEQSGNVLTDYQVKIELNSSNFDSFDKLNSDCSDIRFIDSDDTTELNYYVETCDISNQKVVAWVKVPSIPASGTKTIYIYYGNSGATSNSNPQNTFDFYDDFEDGNLDGWTVQSGTWSVVNCPSPKDSEKCLYGGEGNWEKIKTNDNYVSNDKIIEFEWYYDDKGYSDFGVGYHDGSSWHYQVRTGWGTGYYLYVEGSATSDSSSVLEYGNWYFTRVFFTSSYSEAKVYDLNDVLKATRSINEGLSSTYPVGVTGNQVYGYINWIRVRKYADPEPSFSIGEEEFAGEPFNVQVTYESEVLELQYTNFTINVTRIQDSLQDVYDFKFVWNGTVYEPDETKGNSTVGWWWARKELLIPLVETNGTGINFHWNFTINDTDQGEVNKSTNDYTQVIYYGFSYSFSGVEQGEYYSSINLTVTSQCSSDEGSYYLVIKDGNFTNQTETYPCDGQTRNYFVSCVPDSEGNRTVEVEYFTVWNGTTYNRSNKSVWYWSDLYPPEIQITIGNYSEGIHFSIPTVLSHVKIIDNISSSANCNFVYYYDSEWKNTSSTVANNSDNTFYLHPQGNETWGMFVTCTDLAGHTSHANNTRVIAFNKYTLYDEKTGENWNVSAFNTTVLVYKGTKSWSEKLSQNYFYTLFYNSPPDIVDINVDSLYSRVFTPRTLNQELKCYLADYNKYVVLTYTLQADIYDPNITVQVSNANGGKLVYLGKFDATASLTFYPIKDEYYTIIMYKEDTASSPLTIKPTKSETKTIYISALFTNLNATFMSVPTKKFTLSYEIVDVDNETKKLIVNFNSEETWDVTLIIKGMNQTTQFLPLQTSNYYSVSKFQHNYTVNSSQYNTLLIELYLNNQKERGLLVYLGGFKLPIGGDIFAVSMLILALFIVMILAPVDIKAGLVVAGIMLMIAYNFATNVTTYVAFVGGLMILVGAILFIVGG